MSASTQRPSAALILTHEVADFGTWKSAFDGHEEARRAAGVLGHHINRHVDNPNLLSVYLAVSDVAKAKAFAASDDLRHTLSEAGIKGAPSAVWVKPVSEAIVWDRELPAMMISHQVAEFDTWLAGYAAAAVVRKQGGIIGAAANQLLEEPNTALVYHQAESLDALKAFLANPGLKDAMQKAGVTSAPEVTFVTGGWAKRY